MTIYSRPRLCRLYIERQIEKYGYRICIYVYTYNIYNNYYIIYNIYEYIYICMYVLMYVSMYVSICICIYNMHGKDEEMKGDRGKR